MCRVIPWILGCGLFAVGLRAERVAFFPDWFPGAQFAGIYVAVDLGYYRDAGLEVDIVPFAFGMKPAALIDAEPGRCGVGAIEGYILLQSLGRGLDLMALAAQFQESPAGFMSLASSQIVTAADFRGRKIGVHAYGDPLYRWFLKNAGVPETASTLVFVKDDIGQLLRGEVAAMQGYKTEEFVQLRERAGDAARFVSFRDLGFDAYSEVLFTTRPQRIRHADALARFVAATRRGWAQSFLDREAAIAATLARSRPGAKASTVGASLDALRPYVKPAGLAPLAPMDPEKWRRMRTICGEMGFRPSNAPVEEWLVSGW